jgi:hypothetical protein
MTRNKTKQPRVIIGSSITMHHVEEATRAFLLLHWNSDKLNHVALRKTWAPYKFKGTVPFGDRQGCYALVRDGEVIYIGLGAARGKGIYKEHGIGARLNSHVLRWDRSGSAEMQDRVYTPQEQWSGVSEIFTYGLPSNYGYMACSLEAYLISRLEPERNAAKTASLLPQAGNLDKHKGGKHDASIDRNEHQATHPQSR